MYRLHYIGILFISALLSVAPSVNAAYRSSKPTTDNYHFGYITGGVGYTSLQEEVPDLTPIGGVGGFVGLGYEFRKDGFWMSVGAQLNFHESEADLENYREDHSGYDTQGKEVMLHYSIKERDRQRWRFVEIPIMAGWYFHGFHIGIGPKISYAIDSRSTSGGEYTLSATNELYGIEFKDMPERGYTTYPFEGEHKCTLRPLVSLVGEIGYDVLSSVPTRSTVCHVLKVGFYFEYGLNNLVTPVSTNKRLIINPNDATDVTVNPYFASGMTERYRVVPFFTGVKLTYLIGGSRTARSGGFHTGCHCYNH